MSLKEFEKKSLRIYWLQTIILFFTLLAATILGFQQNKINARLTDLNDFVTVAAVPGGANTFILLNTGKINVYMSAIKMPGVDCHYSRARLITAAGNESYYSLSLPTPQDVGPSGRFEFQVYLQDEFGEKYLGEFGGSAAKTADPKVFTYYVWSYQTKRFDWPDRASTTEECPIY